MPTAAVAGDRPTDFCNCHVDLSPRPLETRFAGHRSGTKSCPEAPIVAQREGRQPTLCRLQDCRKDVSNFDTSSRFHLMTHDGLKSERCKLIFNVTLLIATSPPLLRSGNQLPAAVQRRRLAAMRLIGVPITMRALIRLSIEDESGVLIIRATLDCRVPSFFAN